MTVKQMFDLVIQNPTATFQVWLDGKICLLSATGFAITSIQWDSHVNGRLAIAQLNNWKIDENHS